MSNNLQKKCPLCGHEYDFFIKECPNCGYKKPLSFKRAAGIFFVLLLFVCALFLADGNKDNILELTKNQMQIEPPKEKKLEEIPLRDLVELSNLTKKEILDKRKEYVLQSKIFSDLKDYEPNPEVYQIEDNLPWISAKEAARVALEGNKNIGKGPSRHSLAINNPELLVSFIVPNFSTKTVHDNDEDLFLPKKLVFDSVSKKEIIAYFDFKPFFDKNPSYLGLQMYPEEANARDFGYNWFYCEDRQNIQFINPQNNISLRPYKVQGFYHRGYSCGLELGCNNYSPAQDALYFRILGFPSQMTIKMWKEKPRSYKQKADMTYKMVF